MSDDKLFHWGNLFKGGYWMGLFFVVLVSYFIGLWLWVPLGYILAVVVGLFFAVVMLCVPTEEK